MTNSANKNIFRSIDWVTVIIYVAFVIWGWVTICSASYNFDNPNIFGLDSNSGKQLLWIGIAFFVGSILLVIEKRIFEMYSNFFYWLFIAILLITLVIAPETKGSRSWIPIGFMKLQPAEFAKFSVALALGHLIDKLGFSMSNKKDAWKAATLILLPMAIIILQRETGSALVYLAFFLVLYREGMSGSVLFYFFMAIVYFVVGVRFSDDLFLNEAVSIGEFSVLLLAQVSITLLTKYVCRNDFLGTGRVDDGAHLVLAVKRQSQLLEVQNDLRNVFLDAGDGGKLVQNSIYSYGGDSSAGQGAQKDPS